ncbi:class I SAM-dependent methyltransferase [Desulfotignum phosphitoxidans]|jgi:SAM-dependent methyltransferase|uniref:Type 11 methyltransferase n=1 Tax=Desulfotignum phosphitoxidans DSM 13687 TaxID=1286635 RepID=S0G0T4_9BACT|nr:class I SAM-dependent methyltransferase [Desulfotignum phosphitoxidans]EMS80988.1 type 11 methyltransferase [Desulfotignum phosphitoxidans DSM 13687]
MTFSNYIMEDKDEIQRLDLKTDLHALEKQITWAGLKPGMTVADMGCGPGKTTFHLNRLVSPGGTVTGVDISQERIDYAKTRYMGTGIRYCLGDLRKPMPHLGTFDFIFLRFVLEFYRTGAAEIVANLASLLNPDGILCLADLDHNCLSHYGLPLKLENALMGVMTSLEKNTAFDPYAGRKLYAHLYDLGFEDIRVKVSPHHLIYGKIGENEAFNWRKKIETAAKNSGYDFSEFDNGYEGFRKISREFFTNPRRFTYTPIICCRGRNPR